MHFVFPTPFKRGDILLDVTMNTELNHNLMVFDKMNITDNGAHCAYGYVMEQGRVMYEECNYLNLEYYRKNNFENEYRALEYISKYLCGQLNITGLMNTYHQILCEEEAKSTAIHCWMTESNRYPYESNGGTSETM